MFAEILSIAGPIIGGMMQQDAAESASQIQQQGQADAIAEQRRQYDTTRMDLAPWRDTGSAAVYRLGDLLGLQGGGTPGTGGLTLDQIANQLRSSGAFTIAPQAPQQQMRGTPMYPASTSEANSEWVYRYPDGSMGLTEYKQAAAPAPTIDEAALMAEAQRRFAAQQQSQAGTGGSGPFGPGALLQPFTGKDLYNEPGYQFGLEQMTKGLENQARARGMYYSPATVKELLRYGTDYAGTKFNDAFNRDMSQKTSAYNMLSGVAGTGQTAANTVANAGMNMANTVGGLITSGANARGAAGIAGANAFGSGIGQGVQNYQQQQLMRQLFPQMGGSPWMTPPYNPNAMSPSVGYGMIP